MANFWTEPPHELVKGTEDGDFAVAYLSSDSDPERSHIFRMRTLPEAKTLQTQILSEGDMAQVYDKDGVLV